MLEFLKEMDKEEENLNIPNKENQQHSSTQTLAVPPTQWEADTNEPRIKRERLTTKTPMTKNFNIGISFDKENWNVVRPFLSRIKHLNCHRDGKTFFFDSEDLLKVIDTGKRNTRKRSRSQQYLISDFLNK